MVRYTIPNESQKPIALTLERYNASEDSDIALKADGKIIARICSFDGAPKFIFYQGAANFRAEISEMWS